MLFYLKKIVSALVLLPMGLVVLALAGVWVARRRPRLGRAMTVLSLLALGVLSLPVVSHSLIASLETYPPIANAKEAQAIVILGGGNYLGAPEYGGDTVGRFTLERVRYGARLQQQTGLPILVTGGAPYGGTPEGETMKAVVEGDFHGLVKWVEGASRDTLENAVFSAKLLKDAGITRIALVTQAWHMPRAVVFFSGQGLEVFPAPTGYSNDPPDALAQLLPTAVALERSSRALNEWLGLSLYRLTR